MQNEANTALRNALVERIARSATRQPAFVVEAILPAGTPQCTSRIDDEQPQERMRRHRPGGHHAKREAEVHRKPLATERAQPQLNGDQVREQRACRGEIHRACQPDHATERHD